MSPSSRPHQWSGVIGEYRDWLPVSDETPVITLREGGTPLVEAGWLSEVTRCTVLLKVEGDNPTGSFKDRGMTVAMSLAAEQGAEAAVCASTGNTSASMAAYASRAGIRPIVLVPAGKISRGKMAQAVMHGAHIISVRGGFDHCLQLARELSKDWLMVIRGCGRRQERQGDQSARPSEHELSWLPLLDPVEAYS